MYVGMCVYVYMYMNIHICMAHVDCIYTNLEQLSVDNPQLLLLFKKLKPKV